MLIAGVKGEVYPCKADIFWATYERVHPQPGEAISLNEYIARQG